MTLNETISLLLCSTASPFLLEKYDLLVQWREKKILLGATAGPSISRNPPPAKGAQARNQQEVKQLVKKNPYVY